MFLGGSMQRKRLLYLVWAKGLLGAALVTAALAACEREDDLSAPLQDLRSCHSSWTVRLM